MKRILIACAFAAAWLNVTPAFAVERTVTLAVKNMTCASCPYIVRESLSAVPGVTKVKVSFEKKTAVVNFDDTKTNVDALNAASAKAGYPTQVIGQGS